MPDIPDDLRHLAIQATGHDITVLDDFAWPGLGRPGVWKIADPHGQRYFVKRPSTTGYQREVHAYRHWTSALGENRTPRLLAADDDAHALILTALPGRPVRELRLRPVDESEVYRQAGQLLDRLHAAPADLPSVPQQGKDWTAQQDRALRTAARHLSPDQLTVAEQALVIVPPPLPGVPAHGDFQPRNWLWDPEQRTLRVIDFERATVEPAAQRDLVRMEYRLLTQRPDLTEAFYAGYGREPHREEQRAFPAYAALDAISAIAWGSSHGEMETVSYGVRMLVTLEHRHPVRSSDTARP